MNNEQNIARFEAEMAKVKRPGIDKLMAYIRKSDFYSAPASTHYHLSCEGGLLQHSLNVLDALRGLLTQRPDGDWDYRVATHTVATLTDESVILIALLHDLCKTYFYSTSLRNAKNEQTGKWEKVPFYTVDDKMPLGHGCKSAMLAKTYINLTNDEMYAIWWHMGFTDTDDRLSLGNAIEKYPVVWATHTADIMASNFMEDKGGNKATFTDPEPASAGEYGDEPTTPSEFDEPQFMEAGAL